MNSSSIAHTALALGVATLLLPGCKGKGTDTSGGDDGPTDSGDGGGTDSSEPERRPFTGVVFNELLVETSDGSADWVELYNGGTETADLTGYQLTDSLDPQDAPWTFPAGTELAAGDWLRVFCDDGEGAGDGALHTDFRLNSTGENLWLLTPEGDREESVTWGEVGADIAWAALPDGSEDWDRTATPTPGAANVP